MFFRKAVLIIHGFLGGTYDEEDLANFLELNKSFDVYQFTLPGHKRNLSKIKYTEWVNKCDEMVEWLISKGYRNIYVIGHSMGGVLATYLASKYSEIKKLVLAAPAFNYLTKEKDKGKISSSIKYAPSIVKTYGSNEIIARFLKLNPSAIKEFVDLVRIYYDYPTKVECPTLILQGKNDKIVPVSSSKYVFNSLNSKEKKLILIDGVTHDLFYSKRNEEIYTIVDKFLRGRLFVNDTEEI